MFKSAEKYLTFAVVGVGVLLALKVMNSGVKGTTKDITAGIIGGVASGVAGVLEGAYEAVPDAVKPSSDKNLIYKGVNSIGGALTGDKSFNLGGWIYDKTH